MRRSVGVTVSAVVAIIGSGFTLLFGALMILGSAFVSKSSPATGLPANLAFLLIIEAVIVFGFGGWGLAAGVGLLYLKRWARISMLIYAGILVFVSLPTAAVVAFLPLPNPNDPNLPSNFMAIMRFGMVFFYAAFAALGGFWLYFFNKQGVKAQFEAKRSAVESDSSHLSLGVPLSAPRTVQRARPLSITIIGWFLVIGSAFVPLMLLFNSAFFSDVQFPLYFLGFFFFGRSVYWILIVWMAAQMLAAVGLLKLRRWGLFATIGLQCLTVVNATLLAGIPGNRARFQQIMDTMMASMNARMPSPVPFRFPIWFGFASSLPVVLVILWFLITRRQAFNPVDEN